MSSASSTRSFDLKKVSPSALFLCILIITVYLLWFDIFLFKTITIEPRVVINDHKKCQDLVAASYFEMVGYSCLRIKPLRVSSKKRSCHITFLDENLLDAITKLQFVQFCVIIISSLYDLSSIVNTANLEISS